MSILGLLAGAFFLVVVVAAALPFRGHRRLALEPLAAPEEDRSLVALRGLRDLERDHARGALEDADYEALRPRAEEEAVRALREQTTHQQATAPPARQRRRPTVARSRPRPRTHRQRHLVAGAAAAVALAALALAGLTSGAVGTRPEGGFATGGAPVIRDTETARLESASNAAPNDVEAHLQLAQRYLQLNRTADATRQYLAVLKLDPQNAEASTRMALLIYEGGDSQTALATVDRVLVVHPTHPEALFLKGVILLKALDRPADAVPPLEAYLAVDPNGGYATDAQELLREAKSRS